MHIFFRLSSFSLQEQQKAVRAGIPVLAGGKGPTAEGLRAAKQYGLSLAGNIRNGKISFY